jgi:hypothetical protein
MCVKQQKIGIWTTGLSFVAIGLVILFSINGSIPWNTLKYLWPVILIAFGVEAILTRVFHPDARLRFSGFSIFVILLICLASFAGFVFPRFTTAPSYLVGVNGDVNVGSNVKKVEIHLLDGNISVTGTTSESMTYSGELRVFASSERSAQEKLQSEWKVETNGDTLELIQQQQEVSIPISFFQWNSKSPHLEVQVPQRLLSEVYTNNGIIEVTHMNADSKAETSNGKITFDSIHGNVVGSTSNGISSAMNILGSADLHTSNGRIHVQNVSSALAARTSNGEIEVESPVGGNWTLTTSNGRIGVQIPKGADCRLTGDTSNGGIRGNVQWQFDGEDDNHGTATLGTGKYTVDMHTSNGAIEVNQGN